MKIDFKVVDKNCKEFPLIEKTFNTIIAKLYGSQASALDKIGEGRDRLCEMLFEDGKPMGFIVFKKSLQEEDALELKTLCLLDPGNDSRQGYGSMLLDRAMDTANRRSAARLIVGVSSESSAMNFFERKGFKITQKYQDKYKSGHTENMLSRTVQQQLSAITTSRLPKAAATTTTSLPKAAATTSMSSNSGTVHGTVSFVPDIKCTLKKEYVEAIRSGAKTFEGRVATSYFNRYTPGKTVEWYSGAGAQDKVLTKITSRNVYDSFGDMLTDIGYKKFVPRANSLSHAKQMYDAIPGYSDKVATHGALALGVQLFSPLYNQQRESSSSAASRGKDGDDVNKKRNKYDDDSAGDNQQFKKRLRG